MDGYVVISKQTVAAVINTLQQLDVRGFQSMDMLVGTVRVLTDALNQPQASEAKQKEEAAEQITTVGQAVELIKEALN